MAFMWNKIYTAVLGIFFLLSAGLTYYSYTWLQSVSAPRNVAENYGYFANLDWMLLWISTLILLVLANVVLWTTRNAWAIWATFLYFAFFILLQTFWLDAAFNRYKQQNGLDGAAISLGVFLGVVLIGLAAVIVFFNQFLIKRMRDKMSAQSVPTNQIDINSDSNHDNI
jgi:hypothetical protein